jgi:hypothetical protein
MLTHHTAASGYVNLLTKDEAERVAMGFEMLYPWLQALA